MGRKPADSGFQAWSFGPGAAARSDRVATRTPPTEKPPSTVGNLRPLECRQGSPRGRDHLAQSLLLLVLRRDV
jgi:hypothetical protein